jgi:DNA-binding LacI/PurR family transcriptional regulator
LIVQLDDPSTIRHRGADVDPGPDRAGSQPTVADVARAAGVSRQTVSNVFHAPERVREDTRARVEAAISALGYRPNRLAQSLRAQASRMIGYRIEPMHPTSLASIHDRFLHALADAGREADHHLLLFAADDPTDEVNACVALHRAGAVDGFVIYGIQTDDARLPALARDGVPFAAFGRTGADSTHWAGRGRKASGEPAFSTHPWVDVDNEAGTSSAVEHLCARGHRRIAFVGYPEGAAVGDRRATGWQRALDKHGLLADCVDLDLRGEDTVANGVRLGGTLLDRPESPTAIVAATDTLAVGVLQAIRDRSLVPGRDVAVVGFDDTPTAAALDLSSVRQPIEAVARAMVRALLPYLSTARTTESAEPTGQLLLPALVVRASSAGHAPTT